MTISLARQVELTCSKCGARFSAEIWLIVAVDERPDLMERDNAGTLHLFTCPLGHENTFDTPLLLYRPRDKPVILFVPAQRSTWEQSQKLAAALVYFLRERIGDAWRDEWLGE